MTTTTPPVEPGPSPDADPDPDPDRPPSPVPVPGCPLAGETVLPAETVPVTIVQARQAIVAAFEDGHLSLLDDRGLLAVCEQAFRLVAQTQALAAQVLAEVDGRDAAERICKLTTAHWLHHTTLTATNPTPARSSKPHRWEVRLNHQGLPEFLPPRTHDYQRTPRMHTRYTIAAYQRTSKDGS